MAHRQWVVNAFTSDRFGGNPAAVVLLDRWLDDALLGAIAEQNRFSETAYVVPAGENGDFELRWFTPACEVDLCGHATLASAFVVLRELDPGREVVRFSTRQAGILQVRDDGGWLAMDFPSRPPRRIDVTDRIRKLTGLDPLEAWLSRDLLLVLESAEAVRSCRPDPAGLRELSEFFAIVPTASEGEVGFVSRYFAPNAGLDEDPVTGSSHCTLVPFWAVRLGQGTLQARQLSRQGGRLKCRDLGDRVEIAGQAVLYSRGEIFLG